MVGEHHRPLLGELGCVGWTRVAQLLPALDQLLDVVAERREIAELRFYLTVKRRDLLLQRLQLLRRFGCFEPPDELRMQCASARAGAVSHASRPPRRRVRARVALSPKAGVPRPAR